VSNQNVEEIEEVEIWLFYYSFFLKKQKLMRKEAEYYSSCYNQINATEES
jgi:hypothetical protein